MSLLRLRVLLAAIILTLAAIGAAFGQTDPLPSWNDGPDKSRIIDFVRETTTPGGAQYIEPAARIATFDNDGTLWLEKPAPAQLLFVFDRIRALAHAHPRWKTTEPYASVLKGDMKGLMASGAQGIEQLMAATHAGMTTDQFHDIVVKWIATAENPQFHRPYTQLVYQPMLELLAYLRANGFKTYIVSGGGVEFMRPWADATYGIPPEQVIGSTGIVKYELDAHGNPVLTKQIDVEWIDDKTGKPVAINRVIGRRPIIAVGNSDGDRQMLEWTAAGSGPRLAIYIHHDDAAREVAYDRGDKLAALDKGLDEAAARSWLLVSMKNDWKTIFPPQAQ